MDTTFRTISNTVAEPVSEPVASKEPATQRDVEAEPAFTIYESAKGKSYIAEHYEIGEGWNDNDVYGKEVDKIEDYFKDKIETGAIENTTEAVKELLKKYEKEIGIEKEERTVVKIQKLIAYLDFRRTVDAVEGNNKLYGRTK